MARISFKLKHPIQQEKAISCLPSPLAARPATVGRPHGDHELKSDLLLAGPEGVHMHPNLCLNNQHGCHAGDQQLRGGLGPVQCTAPDLLTVTPAGPPGLGLRTEGLSETKRGSRGRVVMATCTEHARTEAGRGSVPREDGALAEGSACEGRGQTTRSHGKPRASHY